MYSKPITCCFSGHRILPADKIGQIRERISAAAERLINNGILFFCTGGAVGFDLIAAEEIIKLKQKYDKIQLIIVYPFRSSSYGSSADEKRRYFYVNQHADRIVYSSDNYFAGCFYLRDRCIVNASKYCICYLNCKTGGTAYTVDYAKKHDVEIINIANIDD